MKLSFIFGFLMLAACGSAGQDSHTSLAGRSSKPYGIAFKNHNAAMQTVEIEAYARNRLVAKSVCSYSVVGAPSIDGPTTGTITCNDRHSKIRATFSLLQSGMWAGRVALAREEANEYVCYAPERKSSNFLDCYYKAPTELP